MAAVYKNNYGSDQYPEAQATANADSTYGTRGSMGAVQNQQSQPQTATRASDDPYTRFKDNSTKWGGGRRQPPQPTPTPITKAPPPVPLPRPQPPGAIPPTLGQAATDTTDLASQFTRGPVPVPSITPTASPMPVTTSAPTDPRSLAALMGKPTGSAYAPGSTSFSTGGPSMTGANGLTLTPMAGAGNPGGGTAGADKPDTPAVPPPATPPPATTPPPGTVPPPGGTPPRGVTPPPNIPGAYAGDITNPAGSHGRTSGKPPGDGSSAIIQGSNVPKPDGTEDPMVAASWYMASAPGFYGQGVTQKQVADTINTYRSDAQYLQDNFGITGLDYTDWMGIFHPEMTNTSSQPSMIKFADGHSETVMPAGHYQNRSDPAALQAALKLKQSGYDPSAELAKRQPTDPTALQKAQAALASAVPGSPAYIAAQQALQAAQAPPPATPPPAGTPAPPGGQPPPPAPPAPGTTPPPPSSSGAPIPPAASPVPGATPPPITPSVVPPGAPIPPTTNVTPTATGSPFDAAGIKSMFDPLFKQQQSELARQMRAEGAVTGDINAGGFSTALGKAESNLSAQNSATQGQLLAQMYNSAQDRGTQEKIAQLQSDTAIANTKTTTGMQSFIATLQDQTQRLGIQTNADLQKALQDKTLLYQYSALDKNDLLERYKSQLALQGQQFSANAQMNAAALQAAASQAATAAQAAASQRATEAQLQLGLGQQNIDWGNLQAGLYNSDQNRSLQWAALGASLGLTPAQLAQIMGQFAPNPPVLAVPH